jgi:hypothetical protein
LHDSAGGEQEPHEQEPPQVRLPVVPHEAVQGPLAPRTQSNPSSVLPSQSSSRPLQASAGRTQAPHSHDAEHVCVPEMPQGVEHDRSAPAAHE